MGQKKRGCPVEKPLLEAAYSSVRDMGTFLRHYFFLYILDMNITLVSDPFPHRRGGSYGQ